MKKIIFILSFFFLTANINAQVNEDNDVEEEEINPPEIVVKSFGKQFPKAKKLEWSTETPDVYEAEFTLDRKEMSALFDKSGNLIELETEMNKKDLPSSIVKVLSVKFKDHKIDEISQIVADGITTFEIETEYEGNDYELIFNPEGELLKEKANPVENDD